MEALKATEKVMKYVFVYCKPKILKLKCKTQQSFKNKCLMGNFKNKSEILRFEV